MGIRVRSLERERQPRDEVGKLAYRQVQGLTSEQERESRSKMAGIVESSDRGIPLHTPTGLKSTKGGTRSRVVAEESRIIRIQHRGFRLEGLGVRGTCEKEKAVGFSKRGQLKRGSQTPFSVKATLPQTRRRKFWAGQPGPVNARVIREGSHSSHEWE